MKSPRGTSVDQWTLGTSWPASFNSSSGYRKLMHGNRRPGLRACVPEHPNALAPVGHVDVASRVHEHIGAIRDAPFARSLRAVIFFLAIWRNEVADLARQACIRDVVYPQTRIRVGHVQDVV